MGSVFKKLKFKGNCFFYLITDWFSLRHQKLSQNWTIFPLRRRMFSTMSLRRCLALLISLMSCTLSAQEIVQPIKYNDFIGYQVGDMPQTPKTYQHACFFICFSWDWTLAKSISDGKQRLYVSDSPFRAKMLQWEKIYASLLRRQG